MNAFKNIAVTAAQRAGLAMSFSAEEVSKFKSFLLWQIEADWSNRQVFHESVTDTWPIEFHSKVRAICPQAPVTHTEAVRARKILRAEGWAKFGFPFIIENCQCPLVLVSVGAIILRNNWERLIVRQEIVIPRPPAGGVTSHYGIISFEEDMPILEWESSEEVGFLGGPLTLGIELEVEDIPVGTPSVWGPSVRDASVPFGSEFRSPVLSVLEGVTQFGEMAVYAHELGGIGSSDCGLHFHLGLGHGPLRWEDEKVQKAMDIIHSLISEWVRKDTFPAVITAKRKTCSYCYLDRQGLGDDRYHAVNGWSAPKYGTVEVRIGAVADCLVDLDWIHQVTVMIELCAQGLEKANKPEDWIESVENTLRLPILWHIARREAR